MTVSTASWGTKAIREVVLEYREVHRYTMLRASAVADDQRVIIMSRDKDYYQLVTDRVEIRNTRFRAGRGRAVADQTSPKATPACSLPHQREHR